ncbi:MAG: hypothetical protein H0Z33_09920 [Bacillaceae bacterium]|nr:hypothetical protein [Bacillaceae bacterium]
MQIIEQFVKGKYDDEKLCEDAIAVTDDFAAVIDGVSSKTNTQIDDKTTGKIASEILAESLPELDRDMDYLDAFRFLNSRLTGWYEEKGLLDRMREEPMERPSASMTIYSRKHHQIWSIGDCQALCGDYLIYQNLRVDELSSEIRSRMIEFLLQTGYTERDLLKQDLSHEFLEPIFKRQPYIQNRIFNSPYDYTVLDGFEMREDLIRCVPLPDDVDEIILATDGYPKLMRTLEESEAYLNEVLEEDPLCYKVFRHVKGKYEGMVSYDDRAYVRVQL